ncbi:HAMP domain-containing sensor histidine kinase [Chitinimonas sp. BJYL2]|uniref:sensor histidine kinase n=1 Tax=Chitinimonas sp. BJYL2 TaxID=2976696 RepID=UPI0022B55330|nr:ATP-binding protein [Chitinimonas sp. BJYL2]
MTILHHLLTSLQSPLLRSRVAPALLLAGVWLTVVSGVDDWAGRALLLGQLGLLLIWQPVVEPQTRLPRPALVALALVGALMFALFGYGLMMLWLALLASLFGSRLLGVHRHLRRFHLLALSLLLTMLWLAIVPKLAGQALPLPLVMTWVLPLGLCVLAAMPVEPVAVRQQAPVDFFYAVLVFLLALAVPLGAVFLSATLRLSYIESLILVLVLTGGGLGLLAWLWNPRAGFAGIGTLFSASMLQLGTPFEHWSGRLTARAASESGAEEFVRGAVEDLLALPGVSGGRWRLGREEGAFGRDDPTKYRADMRVEAFLLTLYLDQPVAPALHVQFQLIATLLHQFYQAKVRERQLADRVYMEAIYETGARLTHDIKNLLQSLKVLVAAGETSHEPARLNALYARQLPEIARRLEATLGKLSAPLQDDPADSRSALSWWEEVRCRYADASVEFLTPGVLPDRVDALLLSAALDNVVQNAQVKGGAAGVKLQISLLAMDGGVACLEAVDNGTPVPADVAKTLFTRPVRSNTGLGVGLYQIAQLARARGGGIELVENREGRVRFRVCCRCEG